MDRARGRSPLRNRKLFRRAWRYCVVWNHVSDPICPGGRVGEAGLDIRQQLTLPRLSQVHSQIYRDYTNDPLLFCVALTVHRETLTQYITFKRGAREKGDKGSLYSCTLYSWNHRVYRVARVALWNTFLHEGKISPGWWEWGVHAHPLSLHLPSPVKLQCTNCSRVLFLPFVIRCLNTLFTDAPYAPPHPYVCLFPCPLSALPVLFLPSSRALHPLLYAHWSTPTEPERFFGRKVLYLTPLTPSRRPPYSLVRKVWWIEK